MKYLFIFIIIKITILFSFNLFAKNGPVTDLNLPRFVSLKSSDVNLRVGPSTNYPILIKYIQNNLPVEIIDEFDVWRKTKDYDNNIGWIHKSLIKGDRFGLVNHNLTLKKNIYNRPKGKIIGIIYKNNIIKLEKCLINWCYINHKKIEGWISKEHIWGVYPKEKYNLGFMQPLINQYWKILESSWFNQ